MDSQEASATKSQVEGKVTFHLGVRREVEGEPESWIVETITEDFVKELISDGCLPPSVLHEDRGYSSSGRTRKRIEWIDEGCPTQVLRVVRKVSGYEDTKLWKSIIVGGEVISTGVVRAEILEI